MCLMLSQKGVDYIKLFKILYFTQRQHLVEYDRTIFDDTFQARQFGPVSGFIRKGLKLKELSKNFLLILNYLVME